MTSMFTKAIILGQWSEPQRTAERLRKLLILILATQLSLLASFLCMLFISAPPLLFSIPAAPAQYLHQQHPHWLPRRPRIGARRSAFRTSRRRELWCKLPRAARGLVRTPWNTWGMMQANRRSGSIGIHQTQRPA